MGRTFFAGLAVFGAAAIALLVDGLLDLGLGNVMFGIAIGAVLGLSRSGSPIGKIGAFVFGIFIAFVGYALRALLLPSSTGGLLLYMAIVIIIVAGVCALTKNRMPLWAGFLGVATVIGVYETMFLAAPQNLLAELPAQISTVLFPASLAFIVSIFFADEEPPPATPEVDEYNTWSQPPVASSTSPEGN